MKKRKLILVNCLFSTFCLNIFNTISCTSSTNAIEFANFESYMSDSLIDHLHKNFNINFNYYTNNENIPSKFKKYYDIAIPSCYEIVELINKNLLKKIDWSKFNLTIGNKNIENGSDAKDLFIDDIITSINNILKVYILDEKIKNNFNILDYCVPYFLQSLMFAYKGDESAKFYSSEGQPIDDANDATWNDIFYTISPANKNLDKRFIPTSIKKVGMLDDSRSIHDIAKIVESENVTNVPSLNASRQEISNTFKCLTKHFVNKGQVSWTNLNTDSGIIARNLANPYGYSSAITWSGDILYAAFKGAEEFPRYSANNFHIQKTTNGATLNEVDCLVINKNIEKNSKKEQDIYEVIKQVCLDGCNDNSHNITSYDNDSKRYKYWTTENFDSIGYTPMLKNLYSDLIDSNSNYWKDEQNPIDEKTKDMFINILKFEEGKKFLIGTPLSELVNSNLHWSWLQEKEGF